VATHVLVRLALALVCAAGVTVSVISRDSRLKAEGVFRYYFDTHDSRGALARIHDARKLNPSYQLELAEAQLDRPHAVQILQRAVRREPQNAELWAGLTRAQATAGDRAGAARSYARARALAPKFLPPKGPPGS
jgi:predicted Zn-dependent protease